MNEQQPDRSLNISDSILKDVEIGGIAGRDLNVIQGKVAAINVFGTVQVPQAPLSVAQPLSREEYEWRKVFLSKVQQFWIDGVLAKSLHTQVSLELGIEERRDYVPSAFKGIEEWPADSRQVFSVGTSATDIFDGIGAGRTLLILGEPGAGKTVTLLKLAESLIDRAENDLSQPLPAIVNLSSWARQRKSISDWLVQELYEIYQVSKSLGKIWIDKEQLILLLDGLDEVEAQHRNACVRALNHFIQTHGRTEMVVCSRIRDYEALSERLRLRSAIYVRPLTLEQIDRYLEQAGESLVGLKTVLSQNAEIKAFASSPLILSIMSLAYQGYSLNEIVQGSTIQEYRQLLFDSYINRMFEGARLASYTQQISESAKQYPREKVQHWLIGMARQMYQDSQTIFLIEKIQPTFLLFNSRKKLYRAFFGLIGGLFLGVIEGFYWLIHSMQFGGITLSVIDALVTVITMGLIKGLIGGLILGFTQEINKKVTLQFWKRLKQRITNTLVIGIIVGVFLFFCFYISLIDSTSIVTVEIPENLRDAGIFNLSVLNVVFYGFFYGILGGFGFRFSNNITTVEKLQWSSKKMKMRWADTITYGMIFGLILGAIWGLIKVLTIGLEHGEVYILSLIALLAVALFTWVSLGLGLGLSGGVLLGFLVGFLWGLIEGVDSQEIESKTTPNQGIRSSAINAIFMGTIFVFIFGVFFSFLTIINPLYWEIYTEGFIAFLALYIFSNSLFFGYIVSIVRGGGACIQHFSLRFILYCNGLSPWNYKRFLDYASERLFLQKVGGGYIFVHRMLLEHFANMELQQGKR